MLFKKKKKNITKVLSVVCLCTFQWLLKTLTSTNFIKQPVDQSLVFTLFLSFLQEWVPPIMSLSWRPPIEQTFWTMHWWDQAVWTDTFLLTSPLSRYCMWDGKIIWAFWRHGIISDGSDDSRRERRSLSSTWRSWSFPILQFSTPCVWLSSHLASVVGFVVIVTIIIVIPNFLDRRLVMKLFRWVNSTIHRQTSVFLTMSFGWDVKPRPWLCGH